MITPVHLIRTKRDGLPMTREELQRLVTGVVDGSLMDYQLSAWLMAAYLQGLSHQETVALTEAMLHSGDVLTLPSVTRPKVDKHSTGGVGDKITLCLVPMVAACGVAVPMIAGRGLGHTGGTLDKLEAIPGFSTRLSPKQFEAAVRRVGACIIGQTERLAPADRRMYAMRDVTGTVECIPLIVASILSKKLAAGIDGLVLDVKVGRGAFMRDLASARALAHALVRVGQAAGKRVSAILTSMDLPLGRMVGNALEVREAIDVLRGKGPADVTEITVALGVEMLLNAGVAPDRRSARTLLGNAVKSGEALTVFKNMLKAQGGNAAVVDQPELLPRAPYQVAVPAPRSGVVADIDPMAVGELAVEIGAGRLRLEDEVDPSVGIELCAPVGTAVRKGEKLAVLHVADRRASAAVKALQAAIVVRRSAAPALPLVIERIRR